jgi:hypothetical protein
MARISGTYEQTYIKAGYMSPLTTEWKDETSFGTYSNTTGQFSWNPQGENCTLNEIMYSAASQYCQAVTASGTQLTPSWTATMPTYFTPAYIGGANTSPSTFGGLIPLVCIYKINYQAYYNATGTTGTGTG